MPILKIFTNLSKSQIPKDFVHKIIPVLVDGLKKDSHKFTCMVASDCQLSINGVSTEPSVAAVLESIGHLGPEENKNIVKLLSAFLQQEIGVTPARFVLSFYDVAPHNIGKEGTTLAALP